MTREQQILETAKARNISIPEATKLINDATCTRCGNLMEVDSDKVVGYYCPNCRPELQPSARQEFIDNNDAATIDAFSVGGG